MPVLGAAISMPKATQIVRGPAIFRFPLHVNGRNCNSAPGAKTSISWSGHLDSSSGKINSWNGKTESWTEHADFRGPTFKTFSHVWSLERKHRFLKRNNDSWSEDDDSWSFVLSVRLPTRAALRLLERKCRFLARKSRFLKRKHDFLERKRDFPWPRDLYVSQSRITDRSSPSAPGAKMSIPGAEKPIPGTKSLIPEAEMLISGAHEFPVFARAFAR